MKVSRIILLAIVAALILSTIAGCSNSANADKESEQPNNVDTTHVDDENVAARPLPGEDIASNPPRESTASYIPVYLPLPVYEAFAEIATEQDRLDAFLHYTALSAFSSHFATFPIDLRIPSLRLVDTWDAEDGDAYYLCWSAQVYYPRLAEAIRLGEPYAYSYNDMNIRLIRFRIKDTSEWGYHEFKYPQYQCVEILYTPDGETNFSPDMFAGFPGSLERMQQIKSGNQDDYIRDILPPEIARDYCALLETYLEYYGYDIPVTRSN
jgi:hypothetical protein